MGVSRTSSRKTRATSRSEKTLLKNLSKFNGAKYMPNSPQECREKDRRIKS
jgi:hypothetical protein